MANYSVAEAGIMDFGEHELTGQNLFAAAEGPCSTTGAPRQDDVQAFY